MYLLEAADEPVAALRRKLGRLGDSLVVVGGEGLWNVHVHVADAGAAIEAGMAAGRPYRIRVTHLAAAAPSGSALPSSGVVLGRSGGAVPDPSGGAVSGGAVSGAGVSGGAVPGPSGGTVSEGAVVAIVAGDGLAALFAAAGAVVVRRDGERVPDAWGLLGAVRAAGAATGRVAILPDSPEVARLAQTVAAQARHDGLAVEVAPGRTAVQTLAALAVHDAARAFGDDVAAMADAATATRWGRVTWSPAGDPAGVPAGGPAGVPAGGAVGGQESGVASGQEGGAAGLTAGSIGNGVVVSGAQPAAVAVAIVDGLLADESELVTIVTGSPPGDGAPSAADVAAALAAHLDRTRPAVEVATYEGGDTGYLLMIGVE